MSDSDHPRPFAASDARTEVEEPIFFSPNKKIVASRTRRCLAPHAAANDATAEALFGVAARGRHARKHVGFENVFENVGLGANRSLSVSASGAALDSSYNTSDAKTTSNPRRVEANDGVLVRPPFAASSFVVSSGPRSTPRSSFFSLASVSSFSSSFPSCPSAGETRESRSPGASGRSKSSTGSPNA